MNYSYAYINNGQVLIHTDKASKLDTYKNNLALILEQENLIEYIDTEREDLMQKLNEEMEKRKMHIKNGHIYASFAAVSSLGIVFRDNPLSFNSNQTITLASISLAMIEYEKYFLAKKQVQSILRQDAFLILNQDKEIKYLDDLKKQSILEVPNNIDYSTYFLNNKSISNFRKRFNIYKDLSDEYHENNSYNNYLDSFTKEELNILTTPIKSQRIRK